MNNRKERKLLVETGRELLEKNGLYASLYRVQLQDREE